MLTQTITLTPEDNFRLNLLCGPFDDHLRQIEQQLNISINNRGHHFELSGEAQAVQNASLLLHNIYAATENQIQLTPEQLHLLLHEQPVNNQISLHTKRGTLKPRNPHQQQYLNNILKHAINFGIGPAGTGKTYLAVACACAALEREQIRRIILTRPVVEAGEHLGFLPGDLAQKVEPYFRPLYDALYEMLGFERVAKLIEKHVIEIAPLAYMRGRTLNEAFIILDEAQNTTREQMKMFLTRIGFGSIIVINGDVTQVDLPREKHSGLRHAISVLKDLPGISFSYFDSQDVVRHPLVASIVEAYEQYAETK